MTEKKNSLTVSIAKAWILVGTLDILAAIIQTWLSGGSILRLMQYIASGVFGPPAFEGGWNYGMAGLLFHYGIALGWTLLFFRLYPRMPFAPGRPLLTGIGYGIFVWMAMNRVVLPLSQVRMGPFDWSRATLAAMVLILAIGLPLSFLAKKHFSARS